MPPKSQRFSSSQLNTSSLDFNEEDYAKFSADAVFFVLIQERKRIPVKKADIMKVNQFVWLDELLCDFFLVSSNFCRVPT